MDRQEQQKEKILATHRVITMLDRQEIDFLDKLGKDAMFTTGHKLSHNEILKGLIDFAIEIGISGEKIDSLKTLKQKMLDKIHNGLAKAEANHDR
jgi:hypothetical protein